MMDVIFGIAIPFIGTSLGAALVFFMKKEIHPLVQRALMGFAAGVMVAASVWSLLIPAIDQSSDLGAWAFLPAAGGFWLGVLFLLFLDKTVPHLHMNSDQAEGAKASLPRNTMLLLAVTIHNIP
jgi:ZIP family zinc transporter